MTHLRWLDLAVIGVYMVGMLAIGLRFAKRQTSTEQYFIAKRSIPAWAMGVSIFATLISSITFIAYPGNGYAGSWAELVPGFMVIGVLILVGAVIVPFFRRAVRMSAFEYFERRFGYSIRAYTAIGFAAGAFSKMGFVFYLVALTVRSLTGWDMHSVIVVSGAVTVVYTYIGGLEAVIWTDVIQGFILWFGIVISLVYLIALTPGGAPAAFHLAWVNHKFDLGTLDWSLSSKSVWVMAAYGFFWYLQKYTADQTIVQRYLVARSDRDALRGVGLGALLCIPVWALFLLIGTLTWAYYRLSGEALPAFVSKADQVYPHFLATHIPAGLAGVIMASLFAAAMSTISSDLNCFATVGVEDFYRRARPNASDRENLMVGKLIVAAAGALCTVVAILLARTGGTALSLYFTATSILAGGLFGVFFLAFASTRASTAAVWVGIVANLLFTAYATLTSGHSRVLDLGRWNFHAQGVLIGVIGHLLVIVVGYAASFVLPARQPVDRRMTIWGWRNETLTTGAPAPAQDSVSRRRTAG
ncbi:MAG TPA: sodium:solute symporter [Opitutaceae bacterium]|nr:sodium:solute symporter [Opitutaceae bacterium]